MLFLLDSAGWIYIYSTVDGKQLGSVHLAICQSGFTEETNELCDLSNLTRLWVSHELDVVVVVNCFNCAFCVDLEIYFRKHPEHLRRVSKASVNLPLKAPAGIDEDEIASAVYSDKVLNLPFQTDRSWKARLATFYNQTKAPSAEGLQNRSPSSWYNHLSPPNPNDETMRVETVSVSGFSILFSLATPDSESVTVVFWDLETQEVMYHHLDGHCVPVEDDGKEQLCLFLTDSGLSMVLFGFSQEDLLNHLMIYGKAGIVDSLCHLNHWSRCSIPIHALEVIEMEIAADFLNYILNWYCSSGDFTTIHLWVCNTLCKITPALDLLCSAIRENDSETQSKQFSEQLLNLTLTFLNKQMQELLMQSAELDECKQKCVDYLTGYITELRKFMKKYPRTPPNESVTVDDLDEEGALPDGYRAFVKWKNLSTDEVIRDAILSDCIPQAQAYFRTQQNPAKSLQQLVQAGLNLTYNCLLRKDLKEASALLKNMGFDVTKQLRHICCYTADRDLRDFLVRNLRVHCTMHSCSPEVLWSHLTSRHCWSKLCAWIETPQSAESPENWPLLTQETVNQNTLCSSYMRNEILDKLARYILLTLPMLSLLFVLISLFLSLCPKVVELLILAHDCFSLTCHMEGISRVLQAARHLSHKHLAPNEEYSLMVRLITGIGRYNDMTYIFDLLHENHRFEMLLRKNVDSNGNLKTALLDYIKRCLPGDSEKHNMVAFCFSMCREIGENHEGAARVQLKIVESQPWEVTPELKKSLVKVLTFLKDAAESYSKDCCIRRATQCVKLAKLVTLQLHFLNNNHNTQLINLQRSGLMPCILSLPRFYQAAIVAEAYDFVPDWAEVLYQHVIVRGEFTYLEEFKQQHSLQQSLFEEISNKFKQHKGDTAASQNLKRLLQCCEDVYLFYKLAFEHNFNDIANKLLKEPQTSCYLKDMIAS
uniref:SPG11 vesicle trafficking associated, spatacsin n=1 Tax=Callorhinchus milii TaxID=7868 RepID=A0A4W3KDP3_CALMI